MGPRAGPDGCGKSPPRTVKSLASCYTDYDAPALQDSVRPFGCQGALNRKVGFCGLQRIARKSNCAIHLLCFCKTLSVSVLWVSRFGITFVVCFLTSLFIPYAIINNRRYSAIDVFHQTAMNYHAPILASRIAKTFWAHVHGTVHYFVTSGLLLDR